MALRSSTESNSTEVNPKKETDQGSWSNASENGHDANLDISITTVATSPVSNSQLSTKLLFSTSIRPTSMTQLLQSSSPRPDLQCLKVDQLVQEENICNMFNGMEEQQGFWPWPEQQAPFSLTLMLVFNYVLRLKFKFNISRR